MGVERRRALLLSAAGSAVLLIATLLADRPPAVHAASSSPIEFSAQRAKIILQDLVGDGVPHPMGSRASVRVRNLIMRRLTDLGVAAELQSGIACNDGACGRPVNIIATLGGRDARDAVMLSAHYDSVPAGPGASDDGAGVATVLEIARILKSRPPTRHPIVLLIDDGEEDGLLGADLFVREHPLAKTVKAAVNLEARGTSGPSLMFETGTANTWLMKLYAAVIARPMTNSAFYFAYQHLPNGTDFTIYKRESYQGFNFAFIGDVSHYHTPLDNVANASLQSIQHQGDNALSTLLALANRESLQPAAGEATFFDVFSHSLAWWSSGIDLPASIFALVLLLAEAAILFRKRQLSSSAAAWGVVAGAAVPMLAAALSIGLLLLLIEVGKVPPSGGPSWIAHPLLMTLASAATAVVASGCVSAGLGRRIGYWGSWFAAALLSGVCAVATAATLNGTSFLFLLPAFAAALGAVPCIAASIANQPPSAAALDVAGVLPLLMSVALTLPLVVLLYPALGVPGWPVAALLLSPAAASLLLPLAQAGPRLTRAMLVTSMLIVVVGVGVTIFLNTYTSYAPERTNIEYWLDADTRQAHWFVQSDSGRLNPAIRATAQFESSPVARYPGSAALGFRAAAGPIGLAPPELAVDPVDTITRGPIVHYEVTFRSPRGATSAFIVFPAAAAIHEVFLDTAVGRRRVPLSQLTAGGTRLDLAGLGSAGIRVGFDATGAPIPVQIADLTFGLATGSQLQRARPEEATSSQDGDVTVVSRTVTLGPAAGR